MTITLQSLQTLKLHTRNNKAYVNGNVGLYEYVPWCTFAGTS